MSRRTIGIDLGTTNSCVATVDLDGRPRIITNAEGSTTMPSMVTFLGGDGEGHGDGGRTVVGEAAKHLAIAHPENTIWAVKRLIGRRFDDLEVKQLAQTFPYKVVAAPNGDAWVEAGGMILSPPEVSALVLYQLRLQAEEFFGGPVGDAIITVPAYFDNMQRQATKDAAEIAGLRVRRLLNEPTAAALGYGAHRGKNRRFAVCDLGGGTFDVSIVNVEDGVFEVISTHGDAFLGGDDFDRAIIENLVSESWSQFGVNLSEDPNALHALKARAQQAKHDLSEREETVVDFAGVGRGADGKPLAHRRPLTRPELEQWTAPILKRLEAPCREALARCSLSPRDVDAVILVGGMTRMPAVQQRLARVFGREPLKVDNPDEIVSVGAAVQCAILDGTIEGVVLLDVTSRPLGLQVDGGRYQQVIPRNATIPTRDHKLVATTRDGQRELHFDVYEGESRVAARNRHLGRFVCSDLPDAPAGEVLILVDFTIDVDGILRVSTTELSSGERPQLRLVATAGLTRADVQRLGRALPAPG